MASLPLLAALDFITVPNVIVLFGIVYSICLHEAAHAFVSWKLGDPTPRMLGRVTLNPLPHIRATMFATALLPVLTWFAYQGEWALGGGACPVNPRYYRRPARDEFLVAAAGPATNFLLGLLCLLPLASPALTPVGSPNFDVCARLAYINILVAFFNVIPVPPLDGSVMLASILPPVRALNQRLAVFGFATLLLAWAIFPPLWRTLGAPLFVSLLAGVARLRGG